MARNLNNFLLGALQQFQQEREKNTQLQQIIQEAIMKQQFDPEAQFRQQLLGLFQSGGQSMNLGNMQNVGGDQPQQQNATGGFIPESFSYGGLTLKRQPSQAEFQQEAQRKAQQEAMIAEQKPLLAESALRYSGALQGIRDIQKITQSLGLTKEGKIKNIGKAKNLIYRANLNIEGTGARPTLVPMAQGIYKGIKTIRGGDEGSKIGNLFMTLAENLLRARTGAAAPDPEIVREYARSLLKGFIESPETWISKLKQNEEFLLGTAKEMRPTKWQKDLEEYQSVIFNNQQNNQPTNRLGKYTFE